jgi:hypothetical protein
MSDFESGIRSKADIAESDPFVSAGPLRAVWIRLASGPRLERRAVILPYGVVPELIYRNIRSAVVA